MVSRRPGFCAGLRAHEDDAEERSSRRADHQIGDGLRDREVERAEVDRDHSFCSNSVVGSNVPRAKARRAAAARASHGDQDDASSRAPSPPPGLCSTPRARGRAPLKPRRTSAQPPARATCRRPRARRRPPSRRSPERASRKPPRLRRRGYRYASAGASVPSRAPRSRTEDGAEGPARDAPAGEQEDRQCDSDHDRSRGGGQQGRRCARGRVQAGSQTLRYLMTVAATPTGMPTTAPKASPTRASPPPSRSASRGDHRCGEPDQHAAGAGEGERRSLGLHRCGAYQRL